MIHDNEKSCFYANRRDPFGTILCKQFTNNDFIKHQTKGLF